MTTQQANDAIVRPSRQAGAGAVLLVLGCALFALLVRADANVLSGVGLVLAVWGIALLVNSVVLGRRNAAPEPSGQDGFDTRGAVALALAVVLPPLGVIVAAYSPPARGGGKALQPLAIAVGAVLTVVYTLLAVMGAADARSS